MRYVLPFLLACSFVFTLIAVTDANAQQSIKKANMLYKHGLVDDAKREAIQVISSGDGELLKAKAKFLLARIAVDEKRIGHAAELWNDIVKNHAKSEEAAASAEMLKQTGDMLRDGSESTAQGTIARAYFKNAEFWLSSLQQSPTIDTSYISSEGAAVHWLDRIVGRFPKTAAAEAAYSMKVRAYLGVQGRGKYGLGGSGAYGAATYYRSAFGTNIHNDESRRAAREFDKFVKLAKDSLAELEKNFPGSARAPRLRFMIAFAYWLMDDRESAAPLLEKIIEGAGERETLWSQMAKLRLQHWRK